MTFELASVLGGGGGLSRVDHQGDAIYNNKMMYCINVSL